MRTDPAARPPARPPVDADQGPRWSLAGLSLLHGAIFAWAASALPWRAWTLFAGATATLALLHGLTAALALVGSRHRLRAWRASSAAALVYLSYYTYVAVSAATYIAALYGGLGRGVAAGVAAIWAVMVLLTLPLAVWGVAASGGVGRPRRAAGVAAALALLSAFGLWRTATAAPGRPVATPGQDAALEQALAEVVQRAPVARERDAAEIDGLTLFTRAPARCDEPPGAGTPTLIVTYLARPAPPDRAPYRVRTTCLQRADAGALPAALDEAIADAYVRSPMKLDLVTAVQGLAHHSDVIDSLALRPALDGVCAGRRCLMPWQLMALDQFTTYTPLPFIDDLRFGVDAGDLVQALRGFRPRADAYDDAPRPTIEGLTRVATRSYLVDRAGALRPTARARPEVPLREDTLTRAIDGAVDHIIAAQAEDGRFRYLLDPFTGRVSWRGFALPRQAGTTLALCEVGRRSPDADQTAARSLQMMAGLARRSGELTALAYGGPARRQGDHAPRRAALGGTALPLISFLACRDRVGPEHDELIASMGRWLLAMQRPSGGFYPWYDLHEHHPGEGPTPMYAEGQAVFALSLLEALALELGPESPLPPVDALRDAVERAMNYTAGPYWGHALRDFFFLEENWHCLAARASLGHHRNRGYERFCLDYVTFKRRLILDEGARVGPDFVGGYGFGNVLPPHNTPTGGYGEALAAAMAIKRADGLPLEWEREAMELTLAFLVRQQWSADNCIACAPEHQVVGGFSESMASPIVRIDYVQHTLSGLGHGGRMLGVLEMTDVTAGLTGAART